MDLVMHVVWFDCCLLTRGSYMTNPNKGKWYRFNDTVVEEFEMTEESLESECFGGKYKAKFSDTCKFLVNYLLTN